MLLYNKFIKTNKMKLGKHAVKVLAVFAVLFVVGFALKFLNLHEGFYVNPSKFNNMNSYMKKVNKKAKKKSKSEGWVTSHREKGENHFGSK